MACHSAGASWSCSWTDPIHYLDSAGQEALGPLGAIGFVKARVPGVQPAQGSLQGWIRAMNLSQRDDLSLGVAHRIRRRIGAISQSSGHARAGSGHRRP